MTEYRIETDSMGEINVPSTARYGAQTQRAINNSSISGRTVPASFIQAVAHIERSAPQVFRDLGVLDGPIGQAIVEASEAIIGGAYGGQFPVDVCETGWGTRT